MKIAVSIPNDVFAQAERLALKCGMSRSQLYVTALRAYLDSSREEHITEQLNAVYEREAQTPDQFLERAAAAIGRRSQTS